MNKGERMLGGKCRQQDSPKCGHRTGCVNSHTCQLPFNSVRIVKRCDCTGMYGRMFQVSHRLHLVLAAIGLILEYQIASLSLATPILVIQRYGHGFSAKLLAYPACEIQFSCQDGNVKSEQSAHRDLACFVWLSWCIWSKTAITQNMHNLCKAGLSIFRSTYTSIKDSIGTEIPSCSTQH